MKKPYVHVLPEILFLYMEKNLTGWTYRNTYASLFTCKRCIKYSFWELIMFTLEGDIPSGRFSDLNTMLPPSDFFNISISFSRFAI